MSKRKSKQRGGEKGGGLFCKSAWNTNLPEDSSPKDPPLKNVSSLEEGVEVCGAGVLLSAHSCLPIT